jgi:xanthine/uracil permease
MAKKPSNLIYGVDDKLPVTTATLLAIQHVFVMTAGWVMIVVVATTIGANREEVTNVLRMSIIASGIGTILQSLRESHVGSGYLCPISGGPAYISASILAGKAGGLRLVFLMTMIFRPLRGLAGKLAVSDLNDHVRQVFDIAGFSSILSIYTSRDEAVKHVEAP